MRLASIEESRRIDALAQKEFALSGEALMEAAGAIAAREIEQAFIPELRSPAAEIAVVCGSGNNGADGLVVARHLHASGHRGVVVFLLGHHGKASKSANRLADELFSMQLERCRRAGIAVIEAGEDQPIDFKQFKKLRLIVDAIYGTGFRAPVAGQARAAIEQINSLRVPVVSLDIPSGLDGDRGVACDVAVRAEITLSFGLAKPGFFISDGPSCVGRLRVLPIGFPVSLVRREAVSRVAFTERLFFESLPQREATSHKANHGHALLIAGSPGMWGAGLLASTSAFRVGAGYVTWASAWAESEDPVGAIGEYPEILTARLDDSQLWSKPRWNAVGIGPGLGSGAGIQSALTSLKAMPNSQVVCDADALSSLAEMRPFPVPKNWILTPHAGELEKMFARLGDLTDLRPSAREIESDRFRWAMAASELSGATVLLKGFRTVVASAGLGKAWVIVAGNSALAKAGTGDVLTGIIAGLLAQGVDSKRAACAGAYLHGRMADEWIKAGNHRASLTASDLREILPGLMARLAVQQRLG